MSLSSLCPLWSRHFGTCTSIHRQRQKSDNNSGLLMSVLWITILPLISFCRVSMPLNTTQLWRFHGERAVAKACGGWTHAVIVYFCQSAARGDGRIRHRASRGWRGKSRGSEGLTGSSSTSQVYLSKGSPAASQTLADRDNVLNLLTSPRTLRLIYTLKEVQLHCHGERKEERGGRKEKTGRVRLHMANDHLVYPESYSWGPGSVLLFLIDSH